MLLELIIITLFGVLLGIVTGLTPGIHVNTVAVILMPLAFATSPHYVAAIIISVAITHTIFDFIPSILLGAPEADTALSVLPGHRMLLEGKGYEAVYLTAVGSIGSMLLSLFLFPLLLIAIPSIYSSISGHIHFILLFLSSLMILTEKGKAKLYALAIFLLSGMLGILTLDSFMVPQETVLFPIFSGLFGASSMLLSLQRKSTIPEQKKTPVPIKTSVAVSGSAKGFFSGLILGILPGLGAAQATVLSHFLTKKGNDREFLISMGAVSTSVTLFSLLSLYTINKARSGAAVAIQNIMDFGYGELLLTVSVSLVSLGLSAIILLAFLGKLINALSSINYSKLTKLVLAFLIFLVLLFTGLPGLLIMATSTSIGLLAPLHGVKRSINMGVLMLPLMIFYAGL